MARHPQAPRHRVDGQLTESSPPRAERRELLGTDGPDATGRKVYIWGPPRTRPPFPRRPLDPSCVDVADLSADQKAEVVRLVRLVQTDFHPEKDPRGWDSVAEIVRGIHSADTVRQMDYPALAAFFRVRHGQLKIQLGGTIETNTPSIVSYNAAPPAPVQTADPGSGATPPPPAGIALVRADLTKRLQDDWATSTGKRFLLGASIREIADHYGITHSSLYSNTFWNTVIKPARKTTGLRAKSVEWLDSLSRDGR